MTQDTLHGAFKRRLANFKACGHRGMTGKITAGRGDLRLNNINHLLLVFELAQ